MNQHNISRIVTTISFCVAFILLTLIFSYSYLLIQVVAEKENLTQELINARVQLDEEKEKRYLTEQDKSQLSQQIQTLRTQLQQTEEIQCVECDLEEEEENEFIKEIQSCRVDYQEVNSHFIRQACKKTLSFKDKERFEGFTILMDNLDYMNDQEQRELIEFYLKKMDKRNREGVYYAAFIMSELKPSILREYEKQIEDAYRSISYKPGWEKISYKYCQIENKFNDYLN